MLSSFVVVAPGPLLPPSFAVLVAFFSLDPLFSSSICLVAVFPLCLFCVFFLVMDCYFVSRRLRRGYAWRLSRCALALLISAFVLFHSFTVGHTWASWFGPVYSHFGIDVGFFWAFFSFCFLGFFHIYGLWAADGVR